MTTLYNSDTITELLTHFRGRVGFRDITPSVYQNGARSSTVTNAWGYIDDGLAHVQVNLAITAAGSTNNAIYVLLPTYLTPYHTASFSMPVGVYTYLDTGTAYYFGYAYYAGLVTSLPAIGGILQNTASSVGQNPNIATASGDSVGLNLTYRVA